MSQTKIEQFTQLATEYFKTTANASYLDWVESHQAALELAFESETHPYDIIGKITLEACFAAKIELLEEELHPIQAALADTEDKEAKNRFQKMAHVISGKLNKEVRLCCLMQTMYERIIKQNIAKVGDKQDIHYLSGDVKNSNFFRHEVFYAFRSTNMDWFILSEEDMQCKVTEKDKDQLFFTILQHTKRSKTRLAYTFRKPNIDDYNTAPNPKKWLQPIFGAEPHEFFEILFTCIAPDPLARKFVLDSLAFKYRHPHLYAIASPIFVGAGGAGKTLAGEVIAAIFANRAVNWSAKLTDDTMKNTGAIFSNNIIVHFDDTKPISEDSDTYNFLKQNLHAKVLNIRNLHTAQTQIDNNTWVWFSANKETQDVSPIPLAGDGKSGIDRRFTPIIIRKSMEDYVSELKVLSNSEAREWIKHCIVNVIRNTEEVAKFLGSIIVNSDVDNLTELNYPNVYHGQDYYELVGCRNRQITTLAHYMSLQKFNFLRLTDMFDAYKILCKAEGVQDRYVKQRTGFESDFTKTIKKYYPEVEFKNFNFKTGGNAKGWRLWPITTGVTKNDITCKHHLYNGSVLLDEHQALLTHSVGDELPTEVNSIFETNGEEQDNVIKFKPSDYTHSTIRSSAEVLAAELPIDLKIFDQALIEAKALTNTSERNNKIKEIIAQRMQVQSRASTRAGDAAVMQQRTPEPIDCTPGKSKRPLIYELLQNCVASKTGSYS